MKEILDIVSGFLTPIIAILTIIIAYRQYETGNKALRLSLYDKRYKVYSSLMEFLGLVLRDSKVNVSDLIKFQVNTNDSIFLFDDEIREYLEEIYIKAVELRSYNIKLENLPIGEERNKYADLEVKVISWFSEQIKESRNMFKSYLRFK